MKLIIAWFGSATRSHKDGQSALNYLEQDLTKNTVELKVVLLNEVLSSSCRKCKHSSEALGIVLWLQYSFVVWRPKQVKLHYEKGQSA